MRGEGHLRHRLRVAQSDDGASAGSEGAGNLAQGRTEILDEVDRVDGDRTVQGAVPQRQVRERARLEPQLISSDLGGEPLSRGLQHLLRELDADRAANLGAVEQQSQADPAAEADVGGDVSRLQLERLDRRGNRGSVATVETSGDQATDQSAGPTQLAGQRGVQPVARIHRLSVPQVERRSRPSAPSNASASGSGSTTTSEVRYSG